MNADGVVNGAGLGGSITCLAELNIQTWRTIGCISLVIVVTAICVRAAAWILITVEPSIFV